MRANYPKKPNRRKNLQYLPTGDIRNQHGVTFTESEKRALQSAVTRANKKRSEQLKMVSKLPRMANGKPTGDTVQSKLDMGYESDFIIAKKTKSLQRFTSKKQFNQYLKYLERVNSPTYLDDQTRMYKRNYIASLESVHGDNAKDIAMKIRMMKPADFRKLIEQEQLPEIADNYNESDKIGARARLRSSLGMKQKDEDSFFNEEDEE